MNRCSGYCCLALLLITGSCRQGRAEDDRIADEGVRYIQAVEAAYKRAIARSQPSVVSIFLVSRSDSFAVIGNPNGRPPGFIADDPPSFDSSLATPSSIGSGIVVGEKGLVLTCFHVVRAVVNEPGYQIFVQDSNGKRYEGRLFAADPRSDLAVIELIANNEIKLPVMEIGNGKNLAIGQAVLAIGNPFGLASPDGSTSVSAGIISNIRRRPAVPRDEQTILHYGTLLQTDARLNMGVSGGALVNLQGELIGITMALAAAVGYETPGGFALPTDDLTQRIIKTLTEGKEVEYGFIGIRPKSVTAAGAEAMGYLPVEGTIVEHIFTFVPAFRNGLQRGDIITSIGGRPVKDQNDLILAVGSLPVGTVIDAEVVRRKDRMNLKIPLAKYGVVGDVVATNKRPVWNGIRVDHLSTIAREFGLGGDPYDGLDATGVVIKDLIEPSSASEKGLRVGQVITAVNGDVVLSPDEFEQKVKEAKPPVRLQIFRGGDIEIGEPSDKPVQPAPADK